MITDIITSIKDMVHAPVNPYFSVAVKDGQYECGNRESYYAKKLPDETFSYDISNNKVLANADEFGTLKTVTFYRGCYTCDDIPGVWVSKDFGQAGPFYFRLTVEGQEVSLCGSSLPCQSDLAENLIPRAAFTHPRLTATVLAYAPISADGKSRPRALVYGLYLENTTDGDVKGTVIPPDFSPDKDYFTIPDASGKMVECGETIRCGTTAKDGQKIEFGTVSSAVPFHLNSGCGAWFPMVIYAPGESGAVKEIEEAGTLYWLNETLAYFRGMLGSLQMDADPLTAAIFERAVYQGISAVGMDRDGEICGSNWGTFPATRQIWMKDMYYSSLPLSVLNPDFFRQSCLWFTEYGIRPEGSKYQGGAAHSLSNSLTSVLMGVLYYEATADRDFFLTHREAVEAFEDILEEVLTLKEGDVWLFPTVWISDALALGKYHTGSNICAWKAFDGMARLMGEVFEDQEKQKKYGEIAGEIKKAIEAYMVTDGRFGPQYLEGIGGLTPETQKRCPISEYEKKYVDQALTFYPDIIDGDEINLMMHDGEESDTTLIPFYGYKTYDDPVVRNYARFSASEENPTYGTECRGIKWGHESGATFPGYTTAFSGVVDEETMNGERGYMTELKRLCDLDGSWWWWPYKCDTKTGDVVRLNCCGKCGWAAGVFASLFMTQILGVRYDAPSKTLKFKPFSPGSSFEWKDARTGSGKFDFAYRKTADTVTASVTSRVDYPVTLVLTLITDDIPKFTDSGKTAEFEETEFLGKRAVSIQTVLKPDQKIEIAAL